MVKLVDGPHAGEPAYISILLNPFLGLNTVTLASILLSCLYRLVQPKSLSWWRKVDNSLIFQHPPSRGGSLRPQTWNRSEQLLLCGLSYLRPQMWNRSKQQLFYLIALTRIRTRNLWLWYHIELHAPTSSTPKLKLMERDRQFTYIPTDILASLILHRKNKVKHMVVEALQTDIIQVINSSCFLP